MPPFFSPQTINESAIATLDGALTSLILSAAAPAPRVSLSRLPGQGPARLQRWPSALGEAPGPPPDARLSSPAPHPSGPELPSAAKCVQEPC